MKSPKVGTKAHGDTWNVAHCEAVQFKNLNYDTALQKKF